MSFKDFLDQCREYFNQPHNFHKVDASLVSRLIAWKENQTYNNSLKSFNGPLIFGRKFVFTLEQSLSVWMKHIWFIRYLSMICDELVLCCIMDMHEKIHQIYMDDLCIKFHIINSSNQMASVVDTFKKQYYIECPDHEKKLILSDTENRQLFSFIGDSDQQIYPDITFKYSIVNNVSISDARSFVNFPIILTSLTMFTLFEYKKVIQHASEIVTGDDETFIDFCTCLDLPETQTRIRITDKKMQHHNLFTHVQTLTIKPLQTVDKTLHNISSNDQKYDSFYFLVNYSSIQQLKPDVVQSMTIKIDKKDEEKNLPQQHHNHQRNHSIIQKRINVMRRRVTIIRKNQKKKR